MTETLDRVVDAAQGVVTDHIQLFRLEARMAVESALRGGTLLAAGGLLLAIGWVVLLMATYDVLAPRTGGTNALWLLAATNVLLGMVLMGVAHRRNPLEEPHG